jgi:hypothetical protein
MKNLVKSGKERVNSERHLPIFYNFSISYPPGNPKKIIGQFNNFQFNSQVISFPDSLSGQEFLWVLPVAF